MNGIAVLISLAVVGVDYGWQPSRDGQLEYIIQIEPALLSALENGEEIVSEILPEARGVRRFRIRVGTGAVPKVGHLQSGTTPRDLGASNSGTFSSGTGGQQVSPIAPSGSGWGSASAAGSGGFRGNEFRPDGFLNLPPPPMLLGPDGKSSVLVRPGSQSTATAGTNRDVLPPSMTSNPPTSNANALNLAPPPALGSDSHQPDRDIFAPSVSVPSATDLFPPPLNSESTFPAGPGRIDPPLRNDPVIPPYDSQPVRPIPAPSHDSDTPAPIRSFSKSGVKPPGSNAIATLGPTAGTAAVESSNNRSGGKGLLARISGTDAATQKPMIDEETAKTLEPKPWVPLVLTSLGLFGSLAANVYMGWIALGIYRRYRDIVDQLHQARATLT